MFFLQNLHKIVTDKSSTVIKNNDKNTNDFDLFDLLGHGFGHGCYQIFQLSFNFDFVCVNDMLCD